MSLKEAADKYFSNLNPLAARIHQDMEDTKQAYEDLWNEISDEEKQQILSDCIIKPEIVLKYPTNNESPKSPSSYALKLIVDDHCSYRDEHSGPFSFKTKSQRDLSLFPKQIKEKSSNKVNDLKYLPSKEIKKEISQDNLLDCNVNNSETILPRTGLDFLDNW